MPQVPGRVRQAVRRSRRRARLRRRPRRRCPSTRPSSPSARCSATRNAPSIVHANDPLRPARAGLHLHGRDARLRGGGLERGLQPPDVGVSFGWGDHEGMSASSSRRRAREGFGDRLAEGAWRLAPRRSAGRAERLPYAVKGLELPAHSARALKGMSIGYATATRGGSHHDTRPTPQYAQGFDRRSTEDKPAFAARSQHFTAVGRQPGDVSLHVRARLRAVPRTTPTPGCSRRSRAGRWTLRSSSGSASAS